MKEKGFLGVRVKNYREKMKGINTEYFLLAKEHSHKDTLKSSKVPHLNIAQER